MQYAIIDGGKIVNIALCDDVDFAASQGWVKLVEGYWIGDLWSVDGGFAKSS
jgi:hypothetical protein